MSQLTTPTEPGWLPDPSGRYEWRYWDGGWTNRVANSAPPGDTAPTAESTTTPPPAADAAPTEASDPSVEAAPTPPRLSARDPVPRAPFGAEAPPAQVAPSPEPRPSRRSPWTAIVDFLRSFADQPESYHSPLAREPLPDDFRSERLVATAPGNYGHAFIVALAACGVVVGAYLPWISGTIGIAHFHRSGFDEGLGLGYGLGAAALAVSALLSVRVRVVRWLTVILSFGVAGFVVRDVLHTYDRIKELNQSSTVDADVGWGLWIMIVAAAIAMIGAVRMTEDQKIG